MRNRCMCGKMITVRPVKGSYTHGFTVEGHAEYAEHGADIVCAGVSALTQSCQRALYKYDQSEYTIESGHLSVTVSNPNEITHALISSMVSTLRNISKQYQQNLHVEKEKPHDY